MKHPHSRSWQLQQVYPRIESQLPHEPTQQCPGGAEDSRCHQEQGWSSSPAQPSMGQLCPATCSNPSLGQRDFSVIWHSKVPSPTQGAIPALGGGEDSPLEQCGQGKEVSGSAITPWSHGKVRRMLKAKPCWQRGHLCCPRGLSRRDHRALRGDTETQSSSARSNHRSQDAGETGG